MGERDEGMEGGRKKGREEGKKEGRREGGKKRERRRVGKIRASSGLVFSMQMLARLCKLLKY